MELKADAISIGKKSVDESEIVKGTNLNNLDTNNQKINQ